MLDTLLSRLKEEIAIDGPSGSSIDAVWKYAESISNQVAKQSNVSITPKIDGPYKAFIWNYIKQEPELEFFEEVVPPAEENQTNSDDVPMEEQQGTVDQDQLVIAIKKEATEDQDGDVVAMDVVPDVNDTDIATEEAQPENLLIDLLQEAQKKDRKTDAVNRKRKTETAAKKPVPKKKKMKSAPKKKAPKKKRVSAGHSDSDFEMDSDDSESEYDESDLSEVSSEEYSTEGDEDVSDQDDYDKSDYVNKYPTIRRNEDILSNPRNVQQQTRKNNANLTAIQDIADLSYDQVQERYGSRLRIIASARLQDEQLYLGVPPNANITSSLVVILREIIKTRTKGLYQASITRLLNLDSRSTGHYVKSLEDKGAITRRGVSINSMYTNICVHARYSIESNAVDMNTVGDKEAENELPYNVNGHGKVFSQKALLDAMVDLALAAPNGLILAQDVLHGLGFNSTRKPVRKWFNRSIDELCLKGYFEKASIKLDGSRQHRCLHLLKVPEDYEARQASNEQATVPVDELSFPIQIKTTKNQGIPIHHLLCDMPLESQILDVITAAGTHGVVQKDISIALNLDEMRFLSKALEKLSELKSGQGYEQYGIVRHFEFEGRIKRYRYFTLAASIKVDEDRDYIPPPLPSTEVDESKYYERAIFNPVPHTMTSLARYRKMVKKAGHRNVIFKEDVLPKSRKQKLNTDDTPRPKSRYLLQKEKKIAEMLAAEKAAAEGSTNTTSNSTVGPSSTATSSDQPPKAPTTKEIHSFFRASRQTRTRKSDMHLIRPPSPTPVPAPIISQERLACPAPAPKVRPAPSIEAPARKKRKYTKKNAANQVQAVQDGTSISGAEAQSTDQRTTRSGRVIPYEHEPATSSTTPSEAQSDSSVAFESSTQIDTPPSASSEPAQPDGHTATEEPEASTAEGHVQATQSEASASKSPPQSSSPAGAARSEMKSKRKSSPAPVKSYQPRLKNRSIADYFKLTPKTTIPSVAANASAEASSPTVTIPPVEATPTKAKVKETKTVRFAELTPECASESEQSSSSAVTEANPETTTRPSEIEAMKGAVEESTSKDHTEETTATDSDGTAQADVANMEVDKSELGHPAAAAAAIDEVREDGPSVAAMRTTRSRSSTTTPAPVVDQASVTTIGAEESRLFRRYQHEKMHRPVNSYLEARVKILYELLDELRLVEMGNGLAQEFSERAAAQNKSSKYKMDNKTLWTTALELEKRGQAQTTVVECTLLSGKTVYRKVVFHRDMSRDSEEFKTCISFIKERRTGISYRNMPKPVVEVDQVVRLSDQVEQMQKEAQELLMSGQVKKAKQLELRISELSENLETFGRTYGKTRSAHWMIEAVQYGWINACMARTKVFHRYLFRLLEANVEGVDQETRIISVKTVCDNMTFQLLAQVIGVFRPTQLIAEFYKDVNNHKVKMADMSDELKHDLFDENTKFLRRLRKLFNCLEFLQVVSSQFTEVKNNPNFKASKYSHIAPSYKLERTLPIIDRKQAEEPVLREHTIDTMDDLNDYWTDLKFVSLVRDTDKSTLKELDDPYESDLRTSLHSSRNWSTRAMFTRSQRKLLNEKVDKANRKTPLNDMHEIRNLANKINMPIATVQAYYEKVEAALERRLRYSKEKKLERLLLGGQRRRRANRTKYNVYGGRRVITGDSNHAFVAPRRQPSKAGKSYLDDLQDLPVVQGDVFKSLIKRRRKRSVWTTQDDEILLYMYTILRHRSRQNKAKLSWIPAQKMFPDREPQTCRHRKDRMMGQSAFSEKYELYLIYWDAFYREGIANGDITDPDPGDNINLDILSYIEYFVQRLQELDAHPIDLPLYKTLAQTSEMYDIARNEASSPYFEDAFHDGESLVHKLQTLYQAPLTLRKYMDSHYDQSEAGISIEDDATNRLCNMIRAYCLMTLMTPAEVFDPFHAYQILTKFSPQLVDVVFERMKAEKTLILADGDRPIPGTCWALSAKFIKNMSGELPVDLFDQATEYEKFLATQNEKFKFMPYHASSGMMACLLNALSDNQVSFGLANLSLQLRKVNEVGFKTRGVGYSVLTQLGVTIQKNNQADQAITAAPTSSKIHIKNVTNKEYDATLSNLLISQSDKESALIKAVIHALHEQHEVGLTLYQLKMKLQEHHHRFTDHDIIKTVHKLCYNKPALVCRVGFDAVRYVHIKFIDSWTINNKKAKDYKLTEKAREEVMSQTNGQFQTDVVRKDIVIPSLWIDINGNVTELVLNGCKKAILDLVLRKPGIAEADIHRHMVTGLSKREIHDVLDILVEEQALRCIQVQTIPQKEAKQSSIFAKKTVVKCLSTNTIGKLTHSCFWVTPKIFSSTI